MNFILMNEKTKSKFATTLGELFKGLIIQLPRGSAALEINGLTDDSRRINLGDLFVAIPGLGVDGRNYIGEATSMGAVAILTAPGFKFKTTVPVILTENLKMIVPTVAYRFYQSPTGKLTVAGITGTNGKTTVSYLLAAIFDSTGQKWGRIGTTGYDLGGPMLPSNNTTPGPIELQRFFATMVERDLQGCAMEVSSHAMHQGRCEAVKFASATFTNLSQDHLDYHKDMQSYFEAKALLFERAPVAAINIDDPCGRKLVERFKGKVITYSSGRKADLRYHVVNADINGSTLEFEYDGRSVRFELPLAGWFNHQNAAAAAATALGLGLSLERTADGLSCAPAVPGRLQAVKMGQPFGVYIDYAHTPDALEKLLTSLRQFQPKNLRIVFGCGGDRDRTKRPIMGDVASRLADIVYITSDNPRTEEPGAIIADIVKGVADKKRCNVIEDRSQAIKAALAGAQEGDILVIAGKGHEDYQVISTVKKYFSDYEVAKSTLNKLGYAGNDNKD
jgi:UDP-N-acetylmuramoyl-L-alanyl-D-glutamate--2,6-diaminopimelate ligase